MSYTHTKRNKLTAPAVQEQAQSQNAVSGPSLDALRAGLAQPSAEQKGRRVDLPDAMREKMEASFGTDLSAVRLYESQTVADAGAHAVAQGNEIAFAPGMLDFTSFGGQALLGHELSHVVSQSRGEVSHSGGFLHSDALEARADREGVMAAAGAQISMPIAAMSGVTAAPSMGPMQAKKRKDDGAKAKPAAKKKQPKPTLIQEPEEPKEEEVHKSTEEKNFVQLEKLFRIQAGLNSGNPDLVSKEEREWHEKAIKNSNPELIREILKRRDEKGAELMKHRRGMNENNPENRSSAQLDYDARNSAAAYDMDVYHILAKKASMKAKKSFLAGSDMHLKNRSKETADDVRAAYALMRDRTYNKNGETNEEADARKQGYKEMSEHLYKNDNIYVDYSDNEDIRKGWNLVEKDGDSAKVTGEAMMQKEGLGPGAPKTFADGDETEASNFFGAGNNGTFDKWKADLKPDELTALTDYTGNFNKGSFGEFNVPLRKKKPLAKDLQNRLKSINNAMNKYELPEDLEVYRGVTADMFGGLLDAEKIKKYYMGRTMRDRGFVSTSSIQGKQFKKGIQLKIKVPKGKGRGALLSPFSKYPKEHEFLMKNSSAFHVTNVYHNDSDDKTWVELELKV